MSDDGSSNQKLRNDNRTSGNGTTTSTSSDEEKEKSEKQNKMFQGEVRGHLGLDLSHTEKFGCRKRKDQIEVKAYDKNSETLNLTFSASDGHREMKASDRHLQMTLNHSDRSIVSTPTDDNFINENWFPNASHKIKNEPKIIHDQGVAYPPETGYNIDLHHGTEPSRAKYERKKPQIYPGFGSGTRSPLQESRTFENNKKLRPEIWNFTGKLSEENLECDSLKYNPDENSYSTSALSSPTDVSSTTYSGSSESFLSRSLNLIDLTSQTDQIKLRFDPSQRENFKQTSAKPQIPSLADEILKSLHVVTGDEKHEITTDGPATKMTEYLTTQLIPQLQQQEQEYDKAMEEIIKLQREIKSYKENNILLMERIKQLEQERYSSHNSVSSETHVVECTKQKETRLSENLQLKTAAEGPQISDSNCRLLQKVQQLQELNKMLTDANQQWEAQWNLLQKSQNAEIERLNQVIRNCKDQDSRRQGEFDKILLTAKRRQNDEEVAKEEALGNLAQMTGKYEGLQAQYDELKRILEERTKEKNELQMELSNAKTEKLIKSEKPMKIGNKKGDKKLEQQYQTEIAVLKEQLTVFHEDFDRERSDRARAQAEKDDLISQIESLKRENARLTEQARLADKKVQTKVNQISTLQKEVTELRNQQRTTASTRTRQQHPTAPVIQTTQYQNPQVVQQGQQMQKHHPQPKAHPVTDPYAQPLPPYMLQGNENGLTSYPQNPMQQVPGIYPAPQPGPVFGTWNCAFCTYANHPQRTICEICGTYKGKGQTMNGHSRQGSQFLPGGGSRQQYDPNDLCVDSGNWMN